MLDPVRVEGVLNLRGGTCGFKLLLYGSVRSGAPREADVHLSVSISADRRRK